MGSLATNDRFTTVKQMIRDGKINEARLLLTTVRDDPKAVLWLERLNEMAPPDGIDPKITRSREIAARVDLAMAERDRLDRQQRRRGCLWRFVRLGAFLVCQVAWVIPFLIVVNNVTGRTVGPAWLQNSVDRVADSPVTGAVMNSVEEAVGEQLSTLAGDTADGLISQGAGQLMPLLGTVCETQGLTGAELALCQQMIGDVQTCVTDGGNLETCVMGTLEDLCRQQVGNDQRLIDMCLGQMDGLTQYLP